MAVKMAPMPEGVSKALAEGLPRFAVAASGAPDGAPASALEGMSIRPSITRGDRAMAGALKAALDQGPAAGVGAPVVVMGLDQLAEGKNPRGVAPAVWAQLLPAGADGGRAIADVDPAAGKLASVAEGPAVRSLAKRMERAASAESAGGPEQELSLIRIPALHLEAVWLKGAAGEADDVVIPNDGPIAPLKAGHRYGLAEFQAIVREMAAKTLAHGGDDIGG